MKERAGKLAENLKKEYKELKAIYDELGTEARELKRRYKNGEIEKSKYYRVNIKRLEIGLDLQMKEKEIEKLIENYNNF